MVSHFDVIAPPCASIESSFDFTVVAKDDYGNTITGYQYYVQFSSSDEDASLPATTALANGTGDFSATFYNFGFQTLTVSEIGNSSLNGTSDEIDVPTLSISVSSSAGAGEGVMCVVSAVN